MVESCMRSVTEGGLSQHLFLCRPGFEADLAAELASSWSGYGSALANDGKVIWHAHQQNRFLHGQKLPIFARTGWPVWGQFENLPEADRLSVLLPLLQQMPPVAEVYLEHADTNDGRSLQRFLRGFRRALEPALKKRKQLDPHAGLVLHVFFDDSCNGFWGLSERSTKLIENGIPRLRLEREAPSRSALKIEEAWLRLFTESERQRWLRSGMLAVDLGAAPGGWSWQLLKKGMKVQAVDHGKLRQEIMDNYPVQHISEDAFTWQPGRKQDWLVCDIVDKPARTLSLMERWLVKQWARAALFNLKLPMKKRYQEVDNLLLKLTQSLPHYQLRAAQLYHDREEITVVALPQE